MCCKNTTHAFYFNQPRDPDVSQPIGPYSPKKYYSSINSKLCVIKAVLASMIEAEQYFSADS